MNPKTVITVEERSGPWEQVVLQVWPPPPEPVRWPASIGLLDEHGLETLAQRFSPSEKETTGIQSRFFRPDLDIGSSSSESIYRSTLIAASKGLDTVQRSRMKSAWRRSGLPSRSGRGSGGASRRAGLRTGRPGGGGRFSFRTSGPVASRRPWGAWGIPGRRGVPCCGGRRRPGGVLRGCRRSRAGRLPRRSGIGREREEEHRPAVFGLSDPGAGRGGFFIAAVGPVRRPGSTPRRARRITRSPGWV